MTTELRWIDVMKTTPILRAVFISNTAAYACGYDDAVLVEERRLSVTFGARKGRVAVYGDTSAMGKVMDDLWTRSLPEARGGFDETPANRRACRNAYKRALFELNAMGWTHTPGTYHLTRKEA